MTAGEEFERLVQIMHRLRKDCPWDHCQTHATLRAFLLEETYEVLDALDEGATDALGEELGDLMLQIVFHAELAQEKGGFDICDVLRTINEKMVRRHPHVFAEVEADTPDEVLRNWGDIKRQEGKQSALDGVPGELPALLKAVRVLSKMRHAGVAPFAAGDAGRAAAAWLERLQAAADGGEGADGERAAGMLALTMAALAADAGVNPEDALREALGRLADAFRAEESRVERDGGGLDDLDVEQRRALIERLLAECGGSE